MGNCVKSRLYESSFLCFSELVDWKENCSPFHKLRMTADHQDNVSLWLTDCGLTECIDTFKNAGYDDLTLIKTLNEGDLDAMGITKPGTRRKILFYADQLKILPAVNLSFMEQQNRNLINPNPFGGALPNSMTGITTTKMKGNSRANPYRCTKCCEFKIRSLDGKAHQCKPELIGHTWENCPTENIRQHPEERIRRKQLQLQSKSKRGKPEGDNQNDHPLQSGQLNIEPQNPHTIRIPSEWTNYQYPTQNSDRNSYPTTPNLQPVAGFHYVPPTNSPMDSLEFSSLNIANPLQSFALNNQTEEPPLKRIKFSDDENSHPESDDAYSSDDANSMKLPQGNYSTMSPSPHFNLPPLAHLNNPILFQTSNTNKQSSGDDSSSYPIRKTNIL